MSAVELLQNPFDGDEPEAIGSSAIYGFTTFPKELRGLEATQRKIDDFIDHASFQLGRRFTLGAKVFLETGLRGWVELIDLVAEREGLKFADLPRTFQEGIMKGLRDRLARGPDKNPPPSNRATPTVTNSP